MRHPFDGINMLPCDSAERVAASSMTDRRSVLGRIFVAAAGVAMTLLGRPASAQSSLDRRRKRATTFALGEEGAGYPRPPRSYPYPTTRRWGETGRATTFALGEEGGATTFALGEEGGATTFALGEEGGATTFALGEEGGATTYAIGEEGGVTSVRPR